VSDLSKRPTDILTSSSSAGGRNTAVELSAMAITLLNYTDTLREYLEEQPVYQAQAGRPACFPTSLAAKESALRALRSVVALLTSVGQGRPIDRREFTGIVNQAHVQFIDSGLLGPDLVAPFDRGGALSMPRDPQAEWGIPDWCFAHLYTGMEALLQANPDSPEAYT
jgi:hypothetical protein